MGQAVETDTANRWRTTFIQEIQMGQANEIDLAFTFRPYIAEPEADFPYFRPGDYRDLYARFLGPLSQDVVLLINNGTGFTRVPGAKAHISRWRESDLVQGGPVEVGDLRLIIRYTSLPLNLKPLEQKDRIEINGKAYAVIQWDAFSRSVGDSIMAVEATVRG
jgi:hypothetical protein